MARLATKPLPKVTSMPSIVSPDTLVPMKRLAILPFWHVVSILNQKRIQIVLVAVIYASSSLERGKHLSELRNILDEYPGAFNMLLNELESLLTFGRRTGYRYIADYERLLEYVPAIVYAAMLTNQTPLFNSNRQQPLGDLKPAYDALKQQGINPGTSWSSALRYVRMLEIEHERLRADQDELTIARRRKAKSGKDVLGYLASDPLYMATRLFKMFKSARQHVPASEHMEFLRQTIGYTMSLYGLPAQTFEPIAIPESINRGSSKPRV